MGPNDDDEILKECNLSIEEILDIIETEIYDAWDNDYKPLDFSDDNESR